MIRFCGQDAVIEKDNRISDISIDINGDGKVSVKLGRRTDYSDEEIQGFIEERSRFLKNRLDEYVKADLPDFNDGGKVRLLGKEYTVVRSESISNFAVAGNELQVPFRFAKWQSEQFFGNLLFPHVKALTGFYAEAYGLKYSHIGLHTRHFSWGTYFEDINSIRYNKALIFVPENCIEYVVVHELCHSVHGNHGKAFWTEAERIYPRYEEAASVLNSYDIVWLLERAKLRK